MDIPGKHRFANRLSAELCGAAFHTHTHAFVKLFVNKILLRKGSLTTTLAHFRISMHTAVLKFDPIREHMRRRNRSKTRSAGAHEGSDTWWSVSGDRDIVCCLQSIVVISGFILNFFYSRTICEPQTQQGERTCAHKQ